MQSNQASREMRDLRQTKEYAKYLISLGWKPEKIDGIYCLIRKIPFLGLVVKIQRPQNLSEKFFKNMAKGRRFFMLLVEPENFNDVDLLKKLKFKINKEPYIPSKSLEISLSDSLDTIFATFKKDARYSIRKAEKVELESVDDFEEFRKAWRRSVPFKRYVPATTEIKALSDSFKGNTLALMSKDKGAGAFFINSGHKAYYWYGFVGEKGRKTQAQYKILWEGIKWAKKSKAKIFDFEGIYDERFPRKEWLGFTHFKKSFGGKEITYPGAFVKWFWQ
jgi:lipid II:glycine glycyltransferase (peptidoglycan interpeptide bridge formation enzyme)